MFRLLRFYLLESAGIYKVYTFTTEIASTASTAESTDLHGLQLYKAYIFTTETADDCQIYWLYTKSLGLLMLPLG